MHLTKYEGPFKCKIMPLPVLSAKSNEKYSLAYVDRIQISTTIHLDSIVKVTRSKLLWLEAIKYINI